ncbi:MAG: NAD(P)(+) transhydrogenase (Re/Si-specific) subunit beta [SAR202 cluster bacterium]|nr:NAD(P)(+) transhydrogenase (Re/Si-specific) subunit beta [SAR202 cluster bacterium]|tara:strand:- start:29508 stop:30896 length:1389 start_codon:yes stop_codon:yes gene_type:complete
MTLLEIVNISYLVSAVLFIVGLKRLSSPATARSGNLLAATAMLLAVVITLIDREVLDYIQILSGIVLGSIIGAVFARSIQMTAMPQMVAIFNGLGGAASALVASGEYLKLSSYESIGIEYSFTIALGAFIGSVTLSGSFIAFGKLQGIVTSNAVSSMVVRGSNPILFIALVGMIAGIIIAPENDLLFLSLIITSLVLGILLVMPIGGADMPVVIALLNSYSGMAAAAAGFALDNLLLIISGSLVGASGFILTQIMCDAMNRSIWNVMFGAFGAVTADSSDTNNQVNQAISTTAEDSAIILAYAKSVIFVPGYGLAAAQAQHQVRELATLLQSRGVDVRHAIHPVAGRMPGHMNVLLAEADVPYDQLYSMEDINEDFERTDVAVVVGANDVTNPVSRDVPASPIYGMPILNVDMAKTIIFIKRSLSPGFAGIDNPLFYNPKTRMLFDDARRALTEIVNAIKTL